MLTRCASRCRAEAAQLIREGKPQRAEPLLKEALTADITFGPAHNNLAKVYLERGEYYLAAWEFQCAIKLMPDVPEPKNNLGLVLEAVGKRNQAIEQYDAALELKSDSTEFLGNAVRARLARGDRDERVRELLANLLERETRPEWRSWA